MCTGSSVDPLGKPAKFGPFRIFFLQHICANLFVNILVMHFHKVSSNAIGLTLLKLYCQSRFFGIGYICNIFYFLGIISVLIYIFANLLKISCVWLLTVLIST